MPAQTFQDFLKQKNAELRLGSAFTQQQVAAKINEAQQYLTWSGATPSAWDYQQGTVIVNASTAVARSSVFDFGKESTRNALVRIVSTVGATPTATLSIQGSVDGTTWTNLNYSDYLAPGTTSSAALTVTTAGTLIKLVPEDQHFRFLSVNVTADTNVTLTVDVTLL